MTNFSKQPGDEPAPWSIMPGWGVVADLTPPELIEMRKLRSLRKVIAVGLAAVLVLCVAGYVYAMFKESDKQDNLDATHDQGSSLAADKNKYANVTRLKSVTDGIETQISGLMANEVDTAKLVGTLHNTLPGTMSLTSINVALANGDASSSGGTTDVTLSNGASVKVIGTVTLSGSSNKLSDLATYTTALQRTKGLTNILPASNSAGAAGSASWSMTLSLTDALLTHKYDVKSSKSSTGGN